MLVQPEEDLEPFLAMSLISNQTLSRKILSQNIRLTCLQNSMLFLTSNSNSLLLSLLL